MIYFLTVSFLAWWMKIPELIYSLGQLHICHWLASILHAGHKKRPNCRVATWLETHWTDSFDSYGWAEDLQTQMIQETWGFHSTNIVSSSQTADPRHWCCCVLLLQGYPDPQSLATRATQKCRPRPPAPTAPHWPQVLPYDVPYVIRAICGVLTAQGHASQWRCSLCPGHPAQTAAAHFPIPSGYSCLSHPSYGIPARPTLPLVIPIASWSCSSQPKSITADLVTAPFSISTNLNGRSRILTHAWAEVERDSRMKGILTKNV